MPLMRECLTRVHLAKNGEERILVCKQGTYPANGVKGAWVVKELHPNFH